MSRLDAGRGIMGSDSASFEALTFSLIVAKGQAAAWETLQYGRAGEGMLQNAQELSSDKREGDAGAVPATLRLVIAGESDWIDRRREIASVNPQAPMMGLALSGGGIRAAVVARGFIEGLQARGLFARFDYLSSVSGGAYTAVSANEHVGTLGGSLPLPADQYPVQAPRYRMKWLGLVWVEAAFVILIPLLYLAIPLVFALPDARHQGAWDAWIPLLTCVLLAAVPAAFPGLVKRLFDVDSGEVRYFSLGVIALFLLAVAGQWYGHGWMFVPLAMVAAGVLLYLKAHPHRKLAGAIHTLWIGSWVAMWILLAALLAQVAVLAGPESVKRPAYALGFGSLFTVLILINTRRVVDWNRFGGLLGVYRRALAERFLPQPKVQTKLADIQPRANPYPIVNATANNGRQLFHFELAPLFCGGEDTGLWPTAQWLPHVDVADAMAISGGAADVFARRIGLLTMAGYLGGGTGYWVPAGPGRRGKTPSAVAFHALVMGLRLNHCLRLSDGGFVDNLGVLALLKRRVPSIVCLDCGFDPAYRFDALRLLCQRADREGLARLRLPDMASVIASFGFRQASTGVVRVDVEYPANDDQPANIGTLWLVKLHAAHGTDDRSYFNHFPHFATSDQRLEETDLQALMHLGTVLAGQLAAALPDETARPR